MTNKERKKLAKSFLGKTVEIVIDRPLGFIHKKGKYIITYPLNYGFIPGTLGGDGEEIDAYLLGVYVPVNKYKAKIIGIVHREDDIEDKLIAAPENVIISKSEIYEAIKFQEQFFDTDIESIYN